jgi:hypothetical protein
LQTRQVVGVQVGDTQADLGDSCQEEERGAKQDDALQPGKAALLMLQRWRAAERGMVGANDAEGHVLRCIA